MQDEILINRLKRRDMNAFEEVIATYKNYVGAIVKNRISTSMGLEDVEEVVADVFFALWKQSGKLDSKKGTIKNYLGILARNMAINKLRANHEMLLAVDDMEIPDDASPELEIINRETMDILKCEVDTLKYPDIEIFTKYHIYGETVKVIAEEMQLNPNTVKSKLARSRKKLKNNYLKGDILMKICKTNQTMLDEIEQISIQEDQIQLSTDHILKLFYSKVASDKKKSIKRRKAYAAIAACFALAVAINWKGIYTYASELFTRSTAMSQDIILPDENMKLITVNKPERLDHYGTYVGGKSYSSLKECMDELGINILTSDLAYDESYEGKVELTFPLDGDEKFGTNGVSIKDFMYIIGDLKEFERQGTGAVYKTPQTDEDKYASTISLEIEFFITGTKRQTSQANVDYSGLSFTHHETYTSSDGREVQIIGNNSGRINEYIAYFYDNNIKYSLRGKVELSELKRIIDSFH